VIASGEIPSRSEMVGAVPPLAAGRWLDDGVDRAWRDPLPDEMRNALDHFHLPPAQARGNPSWAEWHYFNVLSPDRRAWAFISFIIGGAVPNGQWGGQVLVTTHEQGGVSRRYVATVPPSEIRFSTTTANLAMGSSSVTVLADGRYAVRAHAVAEHGSDAIDVALVVSPAPGVYFPGAEASTPEIVSGYVTPGLRADATGSICVNRRCVRYDRAQSYHDHNWGTWRGVSWDWGASRAGAFTLLYGRVAIADSASASQPVFVYVTDSLGFLTVFRPRDIVYVDSLPRHVEGKTILVPSRATMLDVRGDDTLRVELTIEDATATDTRTARAERGDALVQRGLARPYFVQMKGLMKISGRVAGRVVSGEGPGFFETYR
jgi:hypothetical protein